MHRMDRINKPIKWRVVLAASLVGLLLAACDSQQQAPRQAAVPEVSTLTVQAQKIMEVTELPGRTSAFRVAEIRPQVNGLIQKRLFKEGSNVKAGQVLYRIDPAPLRAVLNNAQAALGRAQANLPSIRSRAQRYQNLLVDKAVSQQDYDDAAAALSQVLADIQYYKASVETARINLGYTEVTAPISGRIGASKVTDGAIVTAYQPSPLATVQQLDPLYVDVPQSTTELLRMKRRMTAGHLNQNDKDQNQVHLILEDGAPYPWPGALKFRDVSVDPTTGSVILRTVFPNPQGILLPEMFVRVKVNEGVNEKAILIPQQAVSRTQRGEPFAMIVDDQNKVGQRMLTIDRARGNQWIVSEGLAPGDRVIIEGLQRVRPGAVVKVVPLQDKKTPPAKPAGPSAEAK